MINKIADSVAQALAGSAVYVANSDEVNQNWLSAYDGRACFQDLVFHD